MIDDRYTCTRLRRKAALHKTIIKQVTRLEMCYHENNDK